MATQPPLTLRLREPALRRADGLFYLLKARLGKVRPEVFAAFAFKNDERSFARRLLERHPRYWLFRTNQQRFCGDFLAVDMASPDVASRRVLAIDLKLGKDVVEGGGGAGNSFTQLDAAVADVARRLGVISPDAAPRRLTGDASSLLAHLG